MCRGLAQAYGHSTGPIAEAGKVAWACVKMHAYPPHPVTALTEKLPIDANVESTSNPHLPEFCSPEFSSSIKE